MYRKIYAIALAAFVLFVTSDLKAQQGVHGARVVSTTTAIVNEYTPLTADVTAGSTVITVGSSTLNANARFPGNLQPGDLIMIYEVQGVFIRNQFDVSGVTDTVWGKVTDYFQCGVYEFAQVKSVPSATTIELDCGLLNNYNTINGQKAEVVRVPRFTSLTINSNDTLTCDDWNGSTGGILAVEVSGNVTVNANGYISANWKGFRGGSLVGDNATTFGANRTYSTNNAEGAEKGEGLVGYQSEYDLWGGRYCRAPGANGGGGGDAHNSGGGGGANGPNSTGAATWRGLGVPDLTGVNYNIAWGLEAAVIPTLTTTNSAGGGKGGYTFSNTNANAIVSGPNNAAWGGDNRSAVTCGLGGRPLDYSTGRLFLGGGGGAGDQNDNWGGPGGDGGGMIYMLVYGSVSGSGNITSNGMNGYTAQGTAPAGSFAGKDGGGGGGAGGTIVVRSIGAIANTLNITANGGRGGNQNLTRGFGFVGSINEAEGPGGGGGGGYITVSSGSPVRVAGGGNNGTTNSDALTEFLPNGATKGCPGTNNATITTWTITANPVTICAGSTATLNAAYTGVSPVGGTLQWFAAAAGGTPIGSGGTYTTPALGTTTTYYVGSCPGWFRIPVTVTVLPIPVTTASASSTTICNGQNTTLTGGGATSYTWNPGAISGSPITVSPTATTTYTVTGSNGTCTSTAQVTVTVNALPTITATAGSTAICAGQSTTLTGGGGNTYTWNPGAMSGSPVTVSPSGTTTYTVNGTNTTTGCTNSAQVTVTVNPLPTVTATAGSTTICTGSSTTLTGGGANTYVWNPGAMSGSPITVTPASTTTYTVTGTTTGTGCTNTAQVTVNVAPPPVTTASASSNTICNGQSTTLTGGGAATYTWNPGNISGSPITVSPTTTTTYTVTGANGTCSSQAQVTITVNALPTITATAGSSTICAGQSTTLTGTGGNTYTWNPGALSGSPVTVSPSGTTTYTVNGTNTTTGCSNSAQVTVTVNALPTVTAAASSTTICAGQSTTLTGTGANTYTWNPGAISGSPVSVTPAATTTYTVNGTNTTTGCSNSAQVTVTVNAMPVTTASASSPTICAGQSTTLTAGGATTYSWNPGSLSGSPVTVSPTTTTTYTVDGTSNGCTSSAQVTVTVNALPVVTASASSTSICAGSSTTLTGNGGNTYSWNPGAMSGSPISVTPASTTTYTVTGTNTATGCTDTGQVTITVNPLPTVTASATANTICNGSNTTLSATGATSYTWNPGSISGSPITVSPTVTTTYTVTGANGGCTNTDQVTITVNALPTVTAASSAPAICAGGSVTLTGNGATSYNWNPGSLSGSPVTDTPAASTTYTVTGTDANGCTDTAQIAVTVNPLPVVTANSTATSVCEGASVTLTGGGATSYSWTGGVSDGVSFTPPVGTNTYTVTGTDGNTCTDTAQITVTVNPLPIVTANSTATTVCAGTSVTLTGSGATGYTWTGGVSDGVAFTPPVGTNTYTVTGTDANTCSDTAQITVTVNALPPVSAGTDVSMCFSGQATLNATGASTYSWSPTTWLSSPNSATTTATPPSTTTYVVTGTDGNGCINTDTVVVNVNSQLIVTASADATVCNGDSTQINVTNTGTYVWSPGTGLSSTTAQNPQAGPATTTTYTVQVTDAFGCQGTDSVTVTVNPVVTVAAGAGTTICIGQQATLTATGSGGDNGPYTYSWNGGAYTGSPVSVSPTTTTTYTVIASDGINCPSSQQTVTITVNPPLSATVAASTGAVCVGGSTNLTATGSGGDGTFTYNWMPGSLTGATVTVTPSVTTTYTVTVSDGCGTPVDTAQVTVVVNQLPVVSVTSSATAGCAPLCVTLTGASSSGTCTTTLVDFGDGNTDNNAVSNHCYTAPGVYDVTFTCTDGNGCTGTVTQGGYITVTNRPSAGFTTDAIGGVVLLSGTSAQICVTDASSGGTSWAYLFNSSQLSTMQSPCFTANDTGTFCIYQVVSDAFSCADSTEICVTVVGELTYTIPNVFTPNADGTNDAFTITNSGLKGLKVDIFDRWGVKVYEWSGPSGGWDGRTTSGQMAVDGTYYYVATMTDYADKVTEAKGFVQLLTGK